MTRRDDVTFNSGAASIAAWFYHPSGAPDTPAPCVVMAHGFAGVKEARLDAFAERFAAAGLACLVFDYRHFGGSGGKPRQLVDIRRQREDWRSALRYARSLPAVDARAIGLWGTSFGGGHVLELTARDARIKAAVLHLPLVDAVATGRHEGIIPTARLAWCGLRDLARAAMRRPPYLIPVVGPPGSVACMSTPEALPGYLSIVTNAPAWRNEVAARIVVGMALFRPIASARRARCPLLFVVGKQDSITPTEVTLKAARRAPRAQVLSLPGGHFDAYLGEQFERAVEAEKSFLLEYLNAAQRPRSVGGQSAPATVA
ncbi:MAG TPA: alpha/beta hydrolase [Dehalococcoidia bacterium]|nr:alpha/beta hydrolase [Dehalococcoidia bacterium]